MRLIVSGVDISHSRLVDLAKLADQAKPFYEWVEKQFQTALKTDVTLSEMLATATQGQLSKIIAYCYAAADDPGVPILFDGIGRTYPHAKACYYFFSWLIRDAPQQRLGPLINRIYKDCDEKRNAIEAKVLAALITRYRRNVRTFSWDAVREVIIDRLEGSRRSIKGHEKETIGRTALVAAFQCYYEKHNGYGVFGKIRVSETQVTVNKETYDVSAELLDKNGQQVSRILMPIKTRETEGGGHAHLFTRDVMQALNAVRGENNRDFLAVVIVARNWAAREAENIRDKVDHAAIFDLSPNEFSEFGDVEQAKLNEFIAGVLDGKLTPRLAKGGTEQHNE
jgi:hypothetical protein